jgi:hypothetical protein
MLSKIIGLNLFAQIISLTFLSLKIIWRHNTQHNDIQHNDTQHNDTHYNDTQHNSKKMRHFAN